jgi:hypothetical protein
MMIKDEENITEFNPVHEDGDELFNMTRLGSILETGRVGLNSLEESSIHNVAFQKSLDVNQSSKLTTL